MTSNLYNTALSVWTSPENMDLGHNHQTLKYNKLIHSVCYNMLLFQTPEVFYSIKTMRSNRYQSQSDVFWNAYWTLNVCGLLDAASKNLLQTEIFFNNKYQTAFSDKWMLA